MSRLIFDALHYILVYLCLSQGTTYIERKKRLIRHAWHPDQLTSSDGNYDCSRVCVHNVFRRGESIDIESDWTSRRNRTGIRNVCFEELGSTNELDIRIRVQHRLPIGIDFDIRNKDPNELMCLYLVYKIESSNQAGNHCISRRITQILNGFLVTELR